MVGKEVKSTHLRKQKGYLLHNAHSACINTFAMTFRFRDGLPLDVGNRSKYDGATEDRPSLFVTDAGPDDAGEYACVIDNDVGRGVAANASNVEVLCESH